MKIIFVLLPIVAVWLLSASEQGLIGSWSILISSASFVSFILCQNIAEKIEKIGFPGDAEPTSVSFGKEEHPPINAMTRRKEC